MYQRPTRQHRVAQGEDTKNIFQHFSRPDPLGISFEISMATDILRGPPQPAGQLASRHGKHDVGAGVVVSLKASRNQQAVANLVTVSHLLRILKRYILADSET